jgi:hypothetical protein
LILAKQTVFCTNHSGLANPKIVIFHLIICIYTFVVDSGSDSLYVFTNQGYEGINPPPNAGLTKQVIVSFGGPGSDGTSSGPFSFKDPSGVCFFRKTIFVADKRNNRICSYKLSNDLE